jgi:universal stress protein A
MTERHEDGYTEFARDFIRSHRASRPRWRIDRILIPTDFSPCSLAALEHAEDLASIAGAELLLLHVQELPLTPAELIELTHDSAEREVSRIVDHFRGRRVRARGLLRAGAPVHEIVEVAADENVSLIVTGTHGRTGVRHLLMGSVAEGLVRTARCPVLTVRSMDRG